MASWCQFPGKASLFLTEQLLEKLLKNVVGHDAGIGIGLPLAMKYGGGRLVDVVGLAKRVILVNQGIERAALYERANLGHFRGGEHRGHGTLDVAVLFPFLLILEERLFHGLDFAELGGGASIARGYPRMRVYGERKIPVNQIDLATGDVIIHEPAIGGGKERLACRALKIAEDFHGDRRVLRAE